MPPSTPSSTVDAHSDALACDEGGGRRMADGSAPSMRSLLSEYLDEHPELKSKLGVSADELLPHLDGIGERFEQHFWQPARD